MKKFLRWLLRGSEPLTRLDAWRAVEKQGPTPKVRVIYPEAVKKDKPVVLHFPTVIGRR